jgi:hypothetical protein
MGALAVTRHAKPGALSAGGLRDYGDTPLSETHTTRGRIVPALFLELTYLAERLLYPEEPSNDLPELSRRHDRCFGRPGSGLRASRDEESSGEQNYAEAWKVTW